MSDDLARARGVVEIDLDASRMKAGEAEFNRHLQFIERRSKEAAANVQQQWGAIVNSTNLAVQRGQMIRGGMTPSQALFAQFNQQLTTANQRYQQQQAIRNAPPPVFGGGGGRGGGMQWGAGRGGFFGAGGLGSRIVGGLRGGLGMGLGVFAAVQTGRAVVEATDLATAYDRQRVASENLAGSQDALNALLNAYNEASGGAVANTTALENITRLQATGFARSAAAVEKFVRGTRGASIALGKPQDYIIQETQLAVSNLSFKRLDQIGLGIEEVQKRIESLRDANKSLTQEMAFSEAVLGLLNEKYGTLSQTAEGQATAVEKLRKVWADLFLEFGQGAQGPVNQLAEQLNLLLGGAGAAGGWLQNQHQRSLQNANFRADTLGITDLIGALTGRTGTQVRAQRVLNQGLPQYGPRGDSPQGDYVKPYAIAPRFSDEQMETISSAYDQQLNIERQYQEARTKDIENYEEQRTSTVRNYAKQMAREEEDFAKQRARSTRDYNKQVTDFLEDAAKRDAELSEDYSKRVGDAREDSEKRISELQEDYLKERERAEEEHRDNLISAAGRLDAIAVLEERKRFRREQKGRDEQHQERLSDERENLQEQLTEAKESLEERLADAREADQERLDDMREARDQQIQDEDEDRAIRRVRAQEDHQNQLSELDRQHALRIKQIEEQAQAERDKWQSEFAKLLDEMDIYIEGFTEKEDARNKLIEDWFDMIKQKLEDEIKQENVRREQNTYNPDSAVGPRLSYQQGGPVHRSGLANVHAGEFVLSRGMLSGRNPIPNSIVNAISNSNRSIEIHPGAIALYPSPGMDSVGMLDMLEDRLVELLERA